MSRQTIVISCIACLLLLVGSSVVGYMKYSAITRPDPPPEAPRSEQNPLAVQATLLQKASAPGSPDCTMQPDREAFLRQLEMEGIILKWDVSENVCRLWVGEPFHAQTFDLKQRLVIVAFAWAKCENSAVDLVRLHDAQTEKTVGHFGMKYGGLKME